MLQFTHIHVTSQTKWLHFRKRYLVKTCQFLCKPLAPVDTFMCYNTFILKCQMTRLGVIMEHTKFELFSWHYRVGTANSTSGVLQQCESFQSSPSSSTKIAVCICTRGCIHSSESRQRQTILRGDSCRLTFSFAPTLALTS